MVNVFPFPYSAESRSYFVGKPLLIAQAHKEVTIYEVRITDAEAPRDAEQVPNAGRAGPRL